MVNLHFTIMTVVCVMNLLTLGDSANTKINIFFINANDDEITKIIINSLKNQHPEYLGQIYTANINTLDARKAIKEICSKWHTSLLNGSENAPDVILDTTTTGKRAKAVQIITAKLGVPTISTQFGYPVFWNHINQDQNFNLIQINPPADILPDIISKISEEFNINSVAILFDQNFSMDRKYNSFFLNVFTRHIFLKINPSRKKLKEQLKDLRNKVIFNFFILGSQNTLSNVLMVSERLHMMDKTRAWFTLSLDGALPYCHHCKNVSIFTFVPHSYAGINLKQLTKMGMSAGLDLSTTFYYEIANTVVATMRSALKSKVWDPRIQRNTCDDLHQSETKVTSSKSLNFRDLVELAIQGDNYESSIFDDFYWGSDNGYHHPHIQMKIKLMEIQNGNITKNQYVGTFEVDATHSMEVTNRSLISSHIALTNYRIVTVLEPPFVMYDNETKKFYGFCIDLLEKIRTKMHFSYEIYKVKDGQSGVMDSEGRWNGMIKEVIEKNADIALSALSVMAEREAVIDFTIPFFDLDGLIILLSKPPMQSGFQFLTILNNEIWFSIIGLYFGASLSLWIFDKWSPICFQNDSTEERVFSFSECLWFCFASLTSLGGGESPRNLSGRLIAAVWWLAGFITISTYTAKLAAFLTLTRSLSEISSLTDLSKQHKIEYSVVINSAAYQYFERMANSEKSLYSIWVKMVMNESMKSTSERSHLIGLHNCPISTTYTKLFQSMKDVGFLKSTAEGIARVRNRSVPFALIGHSAELRYFAMTNCDVTIAKEEVSKRPYAIAVQQGSPLRSRINRALLELIHEREIKTLKEKWWTPKNCSVDVKSFEIGINNIGSVFILILIGFVFVCIVLVYEYFFTYKNHLKMRKIVKRNHNRTQLLTK